MDSECSRGRGLSYGVVEQGGRSFQTAKLHTPYYLTCSSQLPSSSAAFATDLLFYSYSYSHGPCCGIHVTGFIHHLSLSSQLGTALPASSDFFYPFLAHSRANAHSYPRHLAPMNPSRSRLIYDNHRKSLNSRDDILQ